jgi:GGDEF domain-containing protein
VHHTIVWGSVSLILTALVITALSTLFAATQATEILLLAAAVNAVAVLLATLTVARAAQLGDKMARSMVLGCLFMAGSMAGLYSHQISPQDGSLPLFIATSFSTVSFFLVMVSLGIRRNRQIRQLEHLAGLSKGMDPATGLPRGSVLLSKVDDAFWRSARLDTHCSVICLHLRNLYELGEEAGHEVDQQILASMAARIRRAVGFRCVVGLYHPRCFVVVMSAVKHAQVADNLGGKLRVLMCKPLEVLGQDGMQHVFMPQFSVGIVTVTAADAVPAQVIDEAEQLALASERDKPEAAKPVEPVEPIEPAWQPTAS